MILTRIYYLLVSKICRITKKMVKVCAIKSCRATWNPKTHLSFFSCPSKNEELREKWIKALPENSNLSKYSTICSDHFLTDDYEIVFGKRILKKNAIPSIFDIERINPFENIRHMTKLNHMVTNIPVVTSVTDCNTSDTLFAAPVDISGASKHDIGINVSTINFGQSKKKFCNVSVQTCPRLSGPSNREKELQQKIKILQDRLRRRDRRISKIIDTIRHLKEEDKCSNSL